MKLAADGQLHAEGRRDFAKGAYSLGKVVWGKGWEQLLRLLATHAKTHPDSACPLDAFGEGEALASVRLFRLLPV